MSRTIAAVTHIMNNFMSYLLKKRCKSISSISRRKHHAFFWSRFTTKGLDAQNTPPTVIIDGCSMSSSMFARILITILVTSIAVPALAQTQPTRPLVFQTMPTFPSAFATAALSPCFRSYRDSDFVPSRRFYSGRSLEYFNPESPCFSGTIYPSFSAITPAELPSKPSPRARSEGSESLNEEEALLRIGAKGYADISGLEKDKRGIWRGKATLDDGRAVDVTLDLEGNIYSAPTPSRLHIRIEPPPPRR
jgi:hypothetical protein